LLELGSFLLMLYSVLIALYVTRRAARVGLPLLILSLLLSLMILFHGIHHLFAFLEESVLEQAFEFGASVFALALALAYAYIWRRY
jgi:hypothetical protein